MTRRRWRAGALGPRPRGHPRRQDDRGSQALELALAVPLVALLALVVTAIGVAAAQHVAVQTLAATAARTAAVRPDVAVRAFVHQASGPTPATVAIHPATRRRGDLVSVTVTLRHHLLGWPAVAYDVTARATARTELP